MSFFKVRLKCMSCNGTGVIWQPDTEGPDIPHACTKCGGENKYNGYRKGSGYATYLFQATGKICGFCQGRVRYLVEGIEKGENFFGRSYRKRVVKTEVCSACHETGLEWALVTEQECSRCGGTGKVQVWEKGWFFSTEYLVDKTCPTCNGSKVEFHVDKKPYRGGIL